MLEIISNNWEIAATIVLFVYEIIARQIPTEGNWSLVHYGVKILDMIMKNKAKTAEKDAEGKPVEKRFRISRRRS